MRLDEGRTTGPLVLGIDAGGTNQKYAVLDAGGAVLLQGEVPTVPSDPRRSLDDMVRHLEREAPGLPADLAGVGLACAGIVDPVRGRLGNSPNLAGWSGAHLGELLVAAFGPLPTALANDVNSALFGEHRRGAGRGARNLVMLALGTGVGGGVLVDGALVLGAHHGAGEIGHMVLDLDGPRCACGGHGCLEAYAGATGLVQEARRRADGGGAGAAYVRFVRERAAQLTTGELAALALAGDPDAAGLFADAGRRLGQAVGNLINLLDPERVIIGGGVARAGDLLLGPCRELAPTLVLAEEARGVPIVPAELGSLAAAIGAAELIRLRMPAA